VTLIVNEIFHDPGNTKRSHIICAADRRISVYGKPFAERRKLFRSDKMNATVSYFGLAGTDKITYEEVIGDFVRNSPSRTIEDLARSLTGVLNTTVPKRYLQQAPSGLHVCGFTDTATPQFWFIRNIQGMTGVNYTGFEDHYWCSEELSEVHAKNVYDPQVARYVKPFRAWFANGDLRSHGPAWNMFDKFSEQMDAAGLAPRPASPADLEKRLRWKMEALGRYYDIVADEPIVGGGTDTFILTA
jgi:hypothetical protein